MVLSLKSLQCADVCTAADLSIGIREVPHDLGELSLAPYPGDHSPGLRCEAGYGSDGAAESGAVANTVAFFKDALGHDSGGKILTDCIAQNASQMFFLF